MLTTISPSALTAVRAGLAVAPQLVAQSALLELTYTDLERRIEEELSENPALELSEGSSRVRLLLPALSDPPAEGEDLPSWEDRLASPQTLQDDLWLQFRASAPRELQPLGQRLLASLDEAGYLRADLFEVAREVGESLGRVGEALAVLQGLEPAGVGARSLAECLQLQVRRLREEGEEVPAEAEEVVHACAGSAAADLAGQLARRLGLRRARVEEVLAFIRRRLYPYPGYRFYGGAPATGVGLGRRYPDTIVHLQGARFTVEVPLSRWRFLRLNRAYLELERSYQDARDLAGSAGEAASLEQLQHARDFLRMLQRREQVMRVITAAVIERQRGYLLEGPLAHVPLTKKDISLATGLHESTVCRATRGKLVLLPSGELVGFEVFFESGVPEKSLIAQMVHRERRERPLSDKHLATLLHERGYVLARRTVAKYRQALGIPSSSRRRSR